jgi:hypothetical protein
MLKWDGEESRYPAIPWDCRTLGATPRATKQEFEAGVPNVGTAIPRQST